MIECCIFQMWEAAHDILLTKEDNTVHIEGFYFCLNKTQYLILEFLF